jgi:hypothetical protein
MAEQSSAHSRPITVIGIAGHAGFGKSTARTELLKLLPLGKWMRASFASPIKTMIASFGGVSVESLDTTEGKSAICPYVQENGAPVTFARVLQIQGMMFRERLGANVWIRACLENPKHDHIVIDDVRFPGEIDAIHKRGGIVIKLVLPTGFTAVKKLLAGRDPNDLSEKYVDSLIGDYTIVNVMSSGKEALREKLGLIVNEAFL